MNIHCYSRCRCKHVINVVTYNIIYCDCCSSSNKRCCICSLSRNSNNSSISNSMMMPTWYVMLTHENLIYIQQKTMKIIIHISAWYLISKKKP